MYVHVCVCVWHSAGFLGEAFSLLQQLGSGNPDCLEASAVYGSWSEFEPAGGFNGRKRCAAVWPTCTVAASVQGLSCKVLQVESFGAAALEACPEVRMVCHDLGSGVLLMARPHGSCPLTLS